MLHTSDWHLGRSLYGRKRYAEFSAFLEWLLAQLTEHDIDILLIAGDIFDTSTPSHRAQALYYEFLRQASLTCCRHIIVIGGNHDSPSFLEAPKVLLQVFNVTVLGQSSRDIADEVIALQDASGEVEAIICAVPYLRDKDVRQVEAGESADDKSDKNASGLERHYQAVVSIAESIQQTHPNAPIIAMGHLFMADGITMEGDGVRSIMIDSVDYAPVSIFPDSIDYVALGHLHVPQQVAGKAHIRYCGSPIPMGFGEANDEKEVVVVTFSAHAPVIQSHPIPNFQALSRISGNLEEIQQNIKYLKEHSRTAWLEIEYTGTDACENLQEMINEWVDGSNLEVRRVKNRRIVDQVLKETINHETLDDLTPMDVFLRCLKAHEIKPSAQKALISSYQKVLKVHHEQDPLAE